MYPHNLSNTRWNVQNEAIKLADYLQNGPYALCAQSPKCHIHACFLVGAIPTIGISQKGHFSKLTYFY